MKWDDIGIKEAAYVAGNDPWWPLIDIKSCRIRKMFAVKDLLRRLKYYDLINLVARVLLFFMVRVFTWCILMLHVLFDCCLSSLEDLLYGVYIMYSY